MSGKLEITERVICGWNDEVYSKIEAFTDKDLPIIITSNSDVDYVIFENNDRKYAAVFNHNGVSKSVEEGEQINPEVTVSLKAMARNGKISRLLNLSDAMCSVKGGEVCRELRGGEFILFEYEEF